MNESSVLTFRLIGAQTNFFDLLNCHVSVSSIVHHKMHQFGLSVIRGIIFGYFLLVIVAIIVDLKSYGSFLTSFDHFK